MEWSLHSNCASLMSSLPVAYPPKPLHSRWCRPQVIAWKPSKLPRPSIQQPCPCRPPYPNIPLPLGTIPTTRDAVPSPAQVTLSPVICAAPHPVLSHLGFRVRNSPQRFFDPKLRQIPSSIPIDRHGPPTRRIALAIARSPV